MSRHVVVAIFAAVLATPSVVGAQIAPSVPSSQADARCKVGVYYADRSAGGVYRAIMEFHHAPVRPEDRFDLMVVTSHGAWRVPEMHLGHYFDAQELNIPDDGDVRAAWIDSEGQPDGPMHHCEPAIAFLVDGTDGIPKTKRELRDQWAGGYLAKRMTHIAVLPGIEVHNSGKAAQGATAIDKRPCTQELGEVAGPQTKTTLDASGPAIVVNVSPTGHVMTADIVRSYGSTSADKAGIAGALATSFASSPSPDCLGVPHRALIRAS